MGFTLEMPFPRIKGITHCGEALCSRHYRLGAHRHQGIELMYLSYGSVIWRVGRLTMTQSTGELCVIGSGYLHSMDSGNHPEFKALYAGIDLTAFRKIKPALSDKLEMHGGALNLGLVPESENILRGLFHQALALEYSPGVVRKFAELLLVIVSERLVHPLEESPMRRGVSLFSLPIQKTVHYLLAHCNRRIPVKELANLAHMSPAHFAVQFALEVGVPPAQFHRHLRLEEAKALLRTPGTSIALVAHELGFASSQHFSTLFRQAFSLTPTDWVKSAHPQRGEVSCSKDGVICNKCPDPLKRDALKI